MINDHMINGILILINLIVALGYLAYSIYYCNENDKFIKEMRGEQKKKKKKNLLRKILEKADKESSDSE